MRVFPAYPPKEGRLKAGPWPGCRRPRNRLRAIDVEITPEPTETERALILAILGDGGDVAADATRTPWLTAALDDAVATRPADESEPNL